VAEVVWRADTPVRVPAQICALGQQVANRILIVVCFLARSCTQIQENQMKNIISIPALLLLASVAATAQVKDPVSTALREIVPGRQKNTIAAVEAMPADKFNFKPTADQMTFGHLVVHMIESNNGFCSHAADVPAPKVEFKETDPKDKLVAGLKASFDFCVESLAKMDDSKLGETTEAMGMKVSRARVALGIAGSMADHYAETAMYLRLNGVTPPGAKK
jgi:uncharacterized damage-inducible protein DinB